MPIAKGWNLQWALSSIDLTNLDYSKKLEISPEIREEVSFWTDLSMEWSCPIKPHTCSQVITIDADPFRLGVYFLGQETSALVPLKFRAEDIHVKELIALYFALKFYESQLDNFLVWQVVNENARYAIINQGSQGSWILCDFGAKQETLRFTR